MEHSQLFEMLIKNKNGKGKNKTEKLQILFDNIYFYRSTHCPYN